MDVFPGFNTAEDIFSVLVFIMCILIVRKKVFIQYFEDSNPSISKRLVIGVLCGFVVGFVVLSVGVIIELVGLVSENSYWNAFSTTLTIASVSIRDIFQKISMMIDSKG